MIFLHVNYEDSTTKLINEDEAAVRHALLEASLVFLSSVQLSLSATFSELLSSLSDTTDTIRARFDTFCEREPSLSLQPVQYLVRPSGSLMHSLGFLLHYPIFSSTNPLDYGEIIETKTSG